jgi:predicted ATPase
MTDPKANGAPIENGYLSNTTFPVVRNHFVIISGCSGGGKSTVLSELALRGYLVVEEPGRQIVKELQAIGGDGLPWSNPIKFLELALSRYLYQFNVQKEQEKYIFFDRGIIDALSLEIDQPPYFAKAAELFRYNRLVFLAPPWKEIFQTDPERKHNFSNAKKEFDEILVKYPMFGYETVILPKISVKERADFILNRLNSAQ